MFLQSKCIGLLPPHAFFQFFFRSLKVIIAVRCGIIQGSTPRYAVHLLLKMLRYCLYFRFQKVIFTLLDTQVYKEHKEYTYFIYI